MSKVENKETKILWRDGGQNMAKTQKNNKRIFRYSYYIDLLMRPSIYHTIVTLLISFIILSISNNILLGIIGIVILSHLSYIIFFNRVYANNSQLNKFVFGLTSYMLVFLLSISLLIILIIYSYYQQFNQLYFVAIITPLFISFLPFILPIKVIK